MAWTRAIYLTQWADTELAARYLPLLVRKLVRATCSTLEVLTIPANEQTVRPGFDGVVECKSGNQFVPTGRSVWEMGVDKTPSTKAESDIQKRSEQLGAMERAKTVFVFVTPRVWQKKDEWAREKKNELGWKNVVVFDSNDLEHWLELAPGVDAWISQTLRRIPAGLQSLDSCWKSLCEVADPPLQSSVFTASREAEINSVKRMLAADPSSLFLKTSSLSDGVDFLAALASQLFDEVLSGSTELESAESELLSNGIVLTSLEEWRQIVQVEGRLLLIVTTAFGIDSTDVTSAVQSGKHVIVTGPRGFTPNGTSVTLRGVEHYELAKALQNSGYDEAKANSLANACTGSTTILKRRIAKHPATLVPSWATNENASILAPFALLGGWRDVDPTPPRQEEVPEMFRYIPPLDRTVVELLGFSSEELERLVLIWQSCPEPFFLRFGDSVFVTSREDAWYFLGDFITDSLLKKFEDLAILVLDEDSPALDLKKDQRWMASILGKRHPISEDLRKSIVETLAVMTTCPTVRESVVDERFVTSVKQIVETVLPADCTWKRWASLRNYLGVIAEATPELFLSRIENDLTSPFPEVPRLFEEPGNNLFGERLHVDLLWALEKLAWNPSYLVRVSLVLARLAAQVPSMGNYGNRPDRSLHEIFLLWLPHTTATIQQRVSALKRILEEEPVIAWQVLFGLLPAASNSISHNTSMPRWRTWADGWSRQDSSRERYEYAMAIAELTLGNLSRSPSLWADSLDGLLRFNEEFSNRVIVELEEVAKSYEQDTDDAFALWDSLRGIVQLHRQFPDADWVFEPNILEQLSQIQDRLTPNDPVLRNQWLFGNRVDLPGFRKYEQYEEHEHALNELQATAITEILKSQGLKGILRLFGLGAEPTKVGFLCGEIAVWNPKPSDLAEMLCSDSKEEVTFARAYCQGCFLSHGEWTWMESIATSEWPIEAKSELATSLPFGPETWDWVQNQGSEVRKNYWMKTGVFLRDRRESSLRRAVDELQSVGRPFSAISMLHFRFDEKIPNDLVAIALHGILFKESTEEVIDIAYEVQQLVSALQNDQSFSKIELARIEWGLLPLLQGPTSSVGPKSLFTAVCEDPNLYAEIVRAAYRGKNETDDLSGIPALNEFHLQRASEVLDELRVLPGMNSDGSINRETLDRWINDVISKSKSTGHDEIAALKIGQFIGRAIYPHLRQADVIQSIALVFQSLGTQSLGDGLVNGIVNSRGVTVRSPMSGGELEHGIAREFKALAASIEDVSPGLAKCFSTLHLHYERQGKREDIDAERLRLGK